MLPTFRRVCLLATGHDHANYQSTDFRDNHSPRLRGTRPRQRRTTPSPSVRRPSGFDRGVVSIAGGRSVAPGTDPPDWIRPGLISALDLIAAWDRSPPAIGRHWGTGRRCRSLIRFCWRASSSASRSRFISSFRPSPSASAAFWRCWKGFGCDRRTRSTSTFIISGRRSSPSISPWASFPASSWPTSSAPTGAISPTFAGGVTGPLLAYEVLTAFFLEAGFLGVMLFGWNKVGPGLHFFATLMVAARHAGFDDLDPGVQQLDADAAGL